MRIYQHLVTPGVASNECCGPWTGCNEVSGPELAVARCPSLEIKVCKVCCMALASLIGSVCSYGRNNILILSLVELYITKLARTRAQPRGDESVGTTVGQHLPAARLNAAYKMLRLLVDVLAGLL
jgi:hypothetical protein